MDEIYHDESLGAHVNIALVRLIMVGYRQVSPLLTGREAGWMARLAYSIRTQRLLETLLGQRQWVGLVTGKRDILCPSGRRPLFLSSPLGGGAVMETKAVIVELHC